ncbi:E3 ubiquitin-protein ligase RFWD3-like [Lytechinus variegatus]|uniref:E3 ubiquitin-protein ligase RFWD3-like n=1 Tax=Lytechinus variegatus TaxID=7654 RepID=UPI001BB21A65|nr:E3 ubiquitin-protein ligase RFWD3-like [Lytechinus variegatus]
MDHSDSDEDDNGSTILIESDQELYDSDATEISEDEHHQEQEGGLSPTRLGQEEGRDSSHPADPSQGQGSQSDSESLLMLPHQRSENRLDPVESRQDRVPDVDIPGPSGLQTFRTSQSAASSNAHADEPRTSDQSQPRIASSSQGTLESGGNGSPSNVDGGQRLSDAPQGHSSSDALRGQSSNDDGAQLPNSTDPQSTATNQRPEANDMHGASANQDEDDDEPMETMTEDESSNDSMADFQEPKKPGAGACKSGSDGSGSDDESQSCIICYEPWTTSGSHRLVSLRCGHLFGQSCIEQWLKGQGGKCPQCNSKAKRSDVRVIYAKALKVLDTSERDRALKELEREKELRKKAEMDAAQTQLRYVMALEEVKRMKAIFESHQQSTSRNPLSTISSSSNQQSHGRPAGQYMLDKTIQVSPNGNCRVMTYDAANQLLLASMPSTNVLFQGFGLKKISAMDFKSCQYIPIHGKPIRGLSLSGRDDGLLLSASVDKMLKITSLASNTVVQSYTCPMPAWCCAWNTTNTNYVYAGLQNGTVVIYDTRKTDTEVKTLTKEGSRCPIVSLKYVPSKAGDPLPCGGILIGTLEGASFWEQLSCEEYRIHKLHLEGSCTGVAFEPLTRHCLASFRPTKNHRSARYVMCEMKRQSVGDQGNSLVSCNSVQTFFGGTTMKLLTQSALFPAPHDDNKLIACAGDEATSSVFTWDASSGSLTQKLPIGSTALDVCPFNLGDTSYLAALTDKQIKLCKWVQR